MSIFMQWHVPVLAVLTLVLGVASLHIGLKIYGPVQVWSALLGTDTSPDALIVTGLRLPRTVAAAAVGAALGVSGLLMQAVLRNALAEPGLLGVNAGASFSVVFAFAVLGVTGFVPLSLFALVGAGATMGAIVALVTLARGALTPVSLVLAGVTLAAFLASLTQMLIVTDEGTMESLLFWLAGGFADRDGPLLWAAAPLLIILIAMTGPMVGALDAMATGDATAHALGVDLFRLRLLTLGLASMLAGVSVVIAGPVGFVGLVAPHIARLMAGVSHARLLTRTALIGACVALAADIIARRIVMPQEAPVTATLALIGAPVLIALVRSRRLGAAT